MPQSTAPKLDRLFVAQLLKAFLPVALLTCLAAYCFYAGNQEQSAIRQRALESAGVELGRVSIVNVLHDIRRDIELIANHYALNRVLDNSSPEALHYFEQDMLNLAATSHSYNQIRWLDETGTERVRVNYNHGQPTLTPPEALQDKSARYYFSEAMQLQHGETYVSPVDLNVEHGQIEFPPRPMLRIATPVFDGAGKARGVVVLNYFGVELLARFEQALAGIAGHTLLLNRQSFWLNKPLPDINRSFRFSDATQKFAQQHPAVWQRITAAGNGQFEDADGLWTFRTLYPGDGNAAGRTVSDHAPIWRIVAHLPANTLYGNQPQLGLILLTVTALLALQFVGCWKLANVRRAKRAAHALIRQTNQNLQALVEERTAELRADIAQRQQIEIDLRNQTRLYTMLSNINQAIVHLRDEASLLNEACRIAIEDGGFAMAWIGFPSPEHGGLYPVVCAGIDKDALETWQKQCAISICPANTAFSEGCNVGYNDIAHESEANVWRQQVLALGYRSTLSLPLKVNGAVRGVFSLFASHAQAFSEQEFRLLDEMAGDIGFGLEIAEAELARRSAEEHLRLAATVFENSREGVMVTDTDLRIKMINRAFTHITGYSETEIIDQTPTQLSSGRHDRAFYAELWKSIETLGNWQGEIWNRRKNGEVYPELLSISTVEDEQGSITGYVGVFADISKLKASEAKMEFLAHHDPLTALPNRLMLLSRLEHSIDRAQRQHKRLALLMLDLDRFKDVNDSFGHAASDELLQQIAARIAKHLRGVDTISRLGGDEFTILLEDISHSADATLVADMLIDVLSTPCRLKNGVEVHVGVSIGISLYPQHGPSAADLLQQADAALYQAKAEGRGRVAYYVEQLTQNARTRIVMEAGLRRALEQDEFRVYYQPQVDIATGRITGAEALLRWLHPQEGLIPPVVFIPVAEATGLISNIGAWVLMETCRQGRRWLDEGLPPLKLAVNVSPQQLLRGDLIAMVSRTLTESGFPATSLELELTETALMEREQEAVNVLSQLRDLGVHLAIDDFGTGYSSLAYLKSFPLDVLKIDKRFVDDIPGSLDDKEIVSAIIAMGHTLRFRVLAEGVETAEQLAFLQAQGCDSYQGYLKSPPLPADEFAQLLAKAGGNKTESQNH